MGWTDCGWAGRIAAEPHDDRIVSEQSETPRLCIVAARRPAGEVEDFLGRGAADLRRVGRRHSGATSGACFADGSPGDGKLGLLERSAQAKRQPGHGHPVEHRVEMVVPGGCLHARAVEQQLQRGRGGDAGAELDGGGSGRAFAGGKVNAAGVHQVTAVQAFWHQADQEAQELLLGRATLHPENTGRTSCHADGRLDIRCRRRSGRR